MNIGTTVSTAMEQLGLGESFSFDDLVEAMERRRQRPIRIVELVDLNKEDGLCALWFETETEDLVVHAQSDSALHRQQFVLHELAHMILEHDDDPSMPTPDFLLPDIPEATRRRLLGRHDLLTEHEILTEALADQLAAAIRGSASHESRFLEIFG